MDGTWERGIETSSTQLREGTVCVCVCVCVFTCHEVYIVRLEVLPPLFNALGIKFCIQNSKSICTACRMDMHIGTCMHIGNIIHASTAVS